MTALGFLIGTILVFLSTSHPNASYPVSSQLAFRFRGDADFQDGHHSGHLGFPIGTILASLGLQVTPMLLLKFQIDWHLGSGGKAKNRLSRWPPWQTTLLHVRPKATHRSVHLCSLVSLHLPLIKCLDLNSCHAE